MHLKGAVTKHGGRTTPFMSMKGVTHVIAENLSAVKTEKAMKVLPVVNSSLSIGQPQNKLMC